MMIRVFNHLLSIVLGFQYHSQEVIGSLGKLFIYRSVFLTFLDTCSGPLSLSQNPTILGCRCQLRRGYIKLKAGLWTKRFLTACGPLWSHVPKPHIIYAILQQDLNSNVCLFYIHINKVWRPKLSCRSDWLSPSPLMILAYENVSRKCSIQRTECKKRPDGTVGKPHW